MKKNTISSNSSPNPTFTNPRVLRQLSWVWDMEREGLYSTPRDYIVHEELIVDRGFESSQSLRKHNPKNDSPSLKGKGHQGIKETRSSY